MSNLDHHFASPKDKQDFYIALVVIAFFLTGILWAIYPNTFAESILSSSTKTTVAYLTENEPSTAHLDGTDVIIIPPIAAEDKSAIDVETHERVNRVVYPWIDSLMTNNVRNTVVLLPENTATTNTTLAAEQEAEQLRLRDSLNAFLQHPLDSLKTYRQDARLDSIRQFETDTNAVAPIDIPQTKSDREDVAHKEPDKSARKSDTKRCVIMIGAFGDGSNATDLIKRLQAQDYRVYSSYRKGYRTVGVQLDCDQNLLETTLAKIRKTYAPDAFIVK